MMSKEYIEKEAAITEFNKCCDVCMALVLRPMCGECSIADTVRHIKAIPAADVKPVVRGEWIDFGDELDKSAGRHSYQCSHCFTDASYFISGFEWDEWTAPHFCPNCGAEMREANEEGV